MTSPLLAPLIFRNGVSAPNRVWLAPMTNGQSHGDGTLADEELHWLLRRADGGFGVIETCASHVAEEGQGWAGELGIFADQHVPGLRRLASVLRERGACGLVQLFHAGLRADPALSGRATWSASAVAEAGVTLPRAATEHDILGVIERFGDAAKRAAQAGFHGVELHGAHGYLLGQFLSATQNQRTDAWGGSLERRARLLRCVTQRVRAAVPKDFVVGVRLSVEDWGQAKGLDLDENLRVAEWLSADNIDFLHLSLWKAERTTSKRPAEHPIPLFRQVLPQQLPIVVAGNVWTPAEALHLLELGADAVALGRSAIANPDWPRHIDEANWVPRRPPLSPAELLERGLSEKFIQYMRGWRGFVAE